MKRFIVSTLSVAVFFVGIGTLADRAAARIKSDQKALELIGLARQAIGGEAAVANIRSMTVTGKTTRIIRVDGTEKTIAGESEIAMLLPDKFMKKVRIGDADPALAGATTAETQIHVIAADSGERHDVIVEGGKGAITTPDGEKRIIIRKQQIEAGEAATGGEGQKIIVRKMGDGNAEWKTEGGENVMIDKVRVVGERGSMRQNELLRTTLGLLLSAPEGMDVSYTFAGEGNVDGTAVNIVDASFGGSSVKLFLSRSTNLPVMMSYTGHAAPAIFRIERKTDPAVPAGNDVMVFTKKLDGPAPESADYQVKFSDYRFTGGVQLPYRWTTTVGGAADETFEVSAYELNPANIGDRFKAHEVHVRTPHK